MSKAALLPFLLKEDLHGPAFAGKGALHGCDVFVGYRPQDDISPAFNEADPGSLRYSMPPAQLRRDNDLSF
jgi:hypothetical protein